MPRTLRDPVLILTLTVAVMVVGQAASYCPGVFDWEASAGMEGDELSYSVWSNYATRYSVAAFAGSEAPKTAYAFYDGKCGGDRVSWPGIDSELRNMTHELENRGCDLKRVDTAGLMGLIGDPANEKAVLLAIAGVLPREAYDGTPESPLLKWVGLGGRLYWSGGPIGKYSADSDGTSVVQGYSEAIFGVADAVYEGNGKSHGPVADVGEALSLTSNNMKYGLSEDLPGALSFGRSADGYGTAVSVPIGLGSITALSMGGGGLARVDMVQALAAGVTPDTALLGVSHGNVGKGAVSDVLTISAHGGTTTVYAYLGGQLSTRGKCFSFP
ncbi:MAG: hypothetical protein GX224_00570 [Thermoplasmatales archaeon]|nr:hypothetical protein [Thermoplasmatales archaeon]